MSEGERDAGRPRRILAALRRLDSHDLIVSGTRAMRRRLPGDDSYGDPLSTGGTEPPDMIGRRLSLLVAERPSALREVGLSALQVWQSLSEAQGRGRGDEEVTLVFTDLVGFSDWALAAGDADAVELLRCVGRAVEPAVAAHGGHVVKRLGDGIMAAFGDPVEATRAALAAADAVGDVEVAGHRPQLRAGVHLGRPRRIGGDYLGVDVNIAARVAAAAGAGEVLVSDSVAERLDGSGIELKRRWFFRAKGTPKDLSVHSVRG